MNMCDEPFDLTLSTVRVLQVRNLCYMVSRREKLKLLQSKSQEQMFNLHVQLMNQEQSAGEKPILLWLSVW